jgi:hypothetical protein
VTITRANIANYLDEQFSKLAAAIEQDSDVVFGYAPDINAALRKVGKLESELATATVADSQRDTVFALAEYYAARRIWRQLGDRINFSADGTSVNYQHMLANVKAIMEDAASKLAVLGYDVTGQAWGLGWLNLDYLEPEDATA